MFVYNFYHILQETTIFFSSLCIHIHFALFFNCFTLIFFAAVVYLSKHDQRHLFYFTAMRLR